MEETIDIIMPVFKRTVHTDKAIERLKQFTNNYNLILIEKKQSAAKNINEGLKQVKSKWFVIMDDDCWVTPNWLETLKSYRNDSIGQIQPRVLFPFNRMWSAEINSRFLPVGQFDIDIEDYRYIREAPMLTGICGLYNSEILNKGIKQDEAFVKSQFNDIDFSTQIKKSGLKLLYCGKADVIHSRFLITQNDINKQYFKAKWGIN